MILAEARKILGLEVDEDPRPSLEEFAAVREKIAEMVRTAPNEMLAERYQEGLVDFDRAMAAVREYLEELGLVARAEEEDGGVRLHAELGEAVFVEENEMAGVMGLPLLSEEVAEEQAQVAEPRSSMFFGVFCGILLLLAVGSFGTVIFLKYQEEGRLGVQQRVAFLERQGATFIENRRWPEARGAFEEIERIRPDSELVDVGLRSIEAGMAEEQNQFVGYWSGEALASFESGRWEDAERAANQVLEKYPGEKGLQELLGKIAIEKVQEERLQALDAVRGLVEERKFDEGIGAARALLEKDESDVEAREALRLAEVGNAKAGEDLQVARELVIRAKERDRGVYDEQAMGWLREAVSLAPDDGEVVAQFEKMASYTRTIRIPEDVKTVGAALAAAKDRDRLVIGEGVWEGPFTVNAGVELQGVPGKTILRCDAKNGGVITFGPGVRGARMNGVVVRHESFDGGEERFSLVHVQGARVEITDCRFEQGSGHGIAVTEGGHAKVARCVLRENGWNGLAVMGEGSLLEAEENTVRENFQNGIEAWNGGVMILRKNACIRNNRNGIHCDSGGGSATILDNKLFENREFGMVLGSGGAGEATGNVVERNLLGGVVVKKGAEAVVVKDNVISANGGPGLVLEKGVADGRYGENRVSGNSGKDEVTGLDFSE